MSTEVTVREDVQIVTQSEEYFAFPLTPGQRTMLPAPLESTPDSRFNGAFRMNLAGPIDLVLLERSLQEIANRHEALRTVFRSVDGEVMQIILPHGSTTLDVFDFTTLTEQQQVEQIDAVCLREAQANFNLTLHPPVRTVLLRLSSGRSMLVLTIHQIIGDGWSIGIWMEELARIYTAFAAGLQNPLPPLDFQFGDYVVWQQEMTERPEIKEQLTYWKNRLTGAQQIKIEPDFEAPAQMSIQSDILSAMLPGDLSQGLRQLAQSRVQRFSW
ncbi:MAG: condensation domain-containing protein [Edaphobacter sp.]|nr:condensation domain-containing protein [Edaphobacter sp.]MDE1175196.1 condensation domain-containing protein [Edaphobacter sp.]